MSSKRRIRRRQCGHKRRYADAIAAGNVARYFRHQGQHLAPYRCPWCGWWHIGHPNKRQKQAMKARRG